MVILREDLFVALCSAARSPNLACLSGVCQVALSLYAHLGSQLLLQVGCFNSLQEYSFNLTFATRTQMLLFVT